MKQAELHENSPGAAMRSATSSLPHGVPDDRPNDQEGLTRFPGRALLAPKTIPHRPMTTRTRARSTRRPSGEQDPTRVARPCGRCGAQHQRATVRKRRLPGCLRLENSVRLRPTSVRSLARPRCHIVTSTSTPTGLRSVDPVSDHPAAGPGRARRCAPGHRQRSLRGDGGERRGPRETTGRLRHPRRRRR